MDRHGESKPKKRAGVIEQRQEGLFALRLHATGGDFTASQIRKIADVAEKFGRGQIHLTPRQGVEIHFVQKIYIDSAVEQLESAGVAVGTTGPTVRAVSACPGNATCNRGVIETKEIARLLDERFLGHDVPHKLRISVAGCPNNCAKATENDIGIMGGLEPKWQKSECFNCGACIFACPGGAIDVVDGTYVTDRSKCTNCGTCVLSCPNAAWTTAKRGYTVWLGGVMGKQPRLATKVSGLVTSKDELLQLVERAIGYYRARGRREERFGHTLDRIGVETALWEIKR